MVAERIYGFEKYFYIETADSASWRVSWKDEAAA
jgi:hypothetical protein